ncbi:MAG: hypothetical protein IKF91_02150 [Bacilli bacterium]|nr:hypothetical protein [Bacilli bacterium]
MDKKNLDNFERKIEYSVNKEDTFLDSEATVTDVSNYDLSSNSAKEKMSKVPWLIAFFLILIISITTCAMFLNNNPQTIFTMAIDKFFSSITSNISENAYDISKGNIKLDFNINSNDENIDFYRELSKNSFDINYRIDNSNDRAFFKINSNYEGSKSLSFNLYNDRDNMYVYYNDIYNKYVKYEKEKSYKFIKGNDYKVILNALNQAFDKVATSEKISGKKNNLDYDIKTLKVYESKLLINKNNYKRVSETFVNSLKSNEEFVSLFSSISSVSSSDVKKKLDKVCILLKKFFREAENSEITLYTNRKTNDFIKGVFSSKICSFEIFNKNDIYFFNLNDTKDNTKLDGDLKIVSNNKSTKRDISLNINISKGEKMYNANFNIVYTYNKASSFGKINLKNYVKESDLNEIERLELYSKLLEKPSLKAITQFIK